jgi:serine/threonine protein kinase
VGQVIDGQFRIDRFIGEGGFSIVYRGFHLGLEEPIAIKCLKLPSSLGSAIVENFVRRFRDESRLHYRLSQGHLHIVRSIASGTTMAHATLALVPYMVLEWLDGKSLAQDFADRRAARKRGRSLSETITLLDPAIDAVAYAHAQGVVHRDMNPGNLYLAETRHGQTLKVLDFGVAKIFSDHALSMGPRAQTVGQIRMFSPAYGAPEQFDDRLGQVGPWSDVYAIALVLLEALRDQCVMEGSHVGDFALQSVDPTKRPTPRALGLQVNDSVEDVFRRALAVQPQHRFRDAGELWGSLKAAVRDDDEITRRSSTSAPAPPPDGSRQRTLILPTTPVPPAPSSRGPATVEDPTLVAPRVAGPLAPHAGPTHPAPPPEMAASHQHAKALAMLAELRNVPPESVKSLSYGEEDEMTSIMLREGDVDIASAKRPPSQKAPARRTPAPQLQAHGGDMAQALQQAASRSSQPALTLPLPAEAYPVVPAQQPNRTLIMEAVPREILYSPVPVRHSAAASPAFASGAPAPFNDAPVVPRSRWPMWLAIAIAGALGLLGAALFLGWAIRSTAPAAPVAPPSVGSTSLSAPTASTPAPQPEATAAPARSSN